MTFRERLYAVHINIQYFLREEYGIESLLNKFMNTWSRDRDPELYDWIERHIEKDLRTSNSAKRQKNYCWNESTKVLFMTFGHEAISRWEIPTKGRPRI